MKKKFIYFGIAAIPAALCLAFICCLGINQICWDEWTMVDLAKRIEDNELNFADLIAPHGEHRIFFPRLVFLAIAYLTNFNSVAQMLNSWLLLSLVTFVTTNYIAQLKNVSDKKKYFFIALISVLIYSWVQWGNFLYAFGMTFFMALIFPILSYHFLSLMFHAENKRKRNLYYVAALLAAFIASFSSAQGLFAWIVGAIILFILLGKKTFTSLHFITWSLIGVFVWIAYLSNLERLGHHSIVANLVENWLSVIYMFFSVIGNTMLPKASGYIMTVAGAFVMGSTLITCCIVWKNKISLSSILFPIALILNGLFVSGSIALGRAETMSRYTSFPIYILVGLLLIWIEFRARESNIKNGLKIMLSALVLSIPLTMANGFYQGTKWRAMNNYHRYMVETSNINQDKLSSANIPPLYYVNCITGEKVLQCINFLQEHRYNVFHKPTYGVAPILYEEHLGQVNNDVLQLLPHTFQFAPDHIRVITPAETPNYKDKIANLYLDIDGNIYPLFINRYEFSPILQWLTQFDKDKSVSGRGISFVYPQNLTPGIHHVKIKALTVDGKFYIVDPDITFEI